MFRICFWNSRDFRFNILSELLGDSTGIERISFDKKQNLSDSRFDFKHQNDKFQKTIKANSSVCSSIDKQMKFY